MSSITLRLYIAMICTTLLGALSPAIAQAQSPNDILVASRDALAELSGFSAQFRMGGEGGAMFKDTLPSMTGQLFFGTHEEFGRIIHCIGESRDQQSTPSLPIDLLITSDRFIWTDIAAHTINERPATKNGRGIPSAFQFVLLKSIVQDDPYAEDADNAETIDLLTQEVIGDTLCDVIHIKRTKPKGRSSSSSTYTDARWYIGADDKLPRKLEHITDAGLVKITLLFELSNMKVTSPPQDLLDVNRPESFAFKSTMPNPDDASNSNNDVIEPNPIDRPINQNQTNQPTRPVAPRIKRAPAYAFTPVSGTEINNSTQANKITVLYFWGSWCIPCKSASPMVSQLANDFSSDPVDIFGLAIREADPDQTADDFTINRYQHTLVLDADALVSTFKARVFPTLIVINRDGEITYQRSISKELSAEDLIKATKDAIQKAIDSN